MSDVNNIATHPAFTTPEIFSHKPTFIGTWGHQLPVEPAEYLVEGLIPRRAYSLIYGRRGSAKSFFVTHMAYTGALQMSFLGHEVADRFGSVIFVGEKKARFGKRPRAWLKANGHEGTLVPVLVVEGVPNLMDPDSVEQCIAYLNDVARPMMEDVGVPLEAVFFDTLARCLPGHSVSDQAVASQAVESIERIVKEARLSVIPIAHIAKAATNQDATAKGAGEWEDAAEAVVRIEREGQAEIRTVTNTKQSDGPEAMAAAFLLDIVTLGQSKRGRAIDSCVIREADIPEFSGTRARAPSLSADALAIDQAISRMMAEGQTVPVPDVPGPPSNGLAVIMRLLRSKAYELGLRSGEAPEDMADAKAVSTWEERRKKAFERGLGELVKAHKVRREGSHIWPL